MNNDIDNVMLSCIQCQDHLLSMQAPITIKPKPTHPFQETAADCFHNMEVTSS